jgi:hypothetical protein
MKSLGWLLTLALTTAVLALIVAPLVVQGLVVLGAEWAPAWPLRIAALLGYESVLWGTGVGAWLVAYRLGWLSKGGHAVALILAAPVSETTVALALGRLPPGFSTLPGVVVRVVVAVTALAVVVMLARRRRSAPQVPGDPD